MEQSNRKRNQKWAEKQDSLIKKLEPANEKLLKCLNIPNVYSFNQMPQEATENEVSFNQTFKQIVKSLSPEPDKLLIQKTIDVSRISNIIQNAQENAENKPISSSKLGDALEAALKGNLGYSDLQKILDPDKKVKEQEKSRVRPGGFRQASYSSDCHWETLKKQNSNQLLLEQPMVPNKPTLPVKKPVNEVDNILSNLLLHQKQDIQPRKAPEQLFKVDRHPKEEHMMKEPSPKHSPTHLEPKGGEDAQAIKLEKVSKNSQDEDECKK